jgi:hypothetical protein
VPGNANDRRVNLLALVLPSNLVMRTMLVSSAAALTVLMLAAHPAAQILTSSEVHRAMEAQEPAAHSKLRAHFIALSARYSADADRHLTFARSAAGAARGAGVAAAKHHERLAARCASVDASPNRCSNPICGLFCSGSGASSPCQASGLR